MPYTLIGLMICVLGGAGSVVGSVTAALILAITETSIMYVASPALRFLATYY